MVKVFIDGEHGTTGLQITKRLEMRDDIELLSIPKVDRRNFDIRADYLHKADIVILCLPDDASKEAVKLLQGSPTRIIDSSTAFRVDPNWTYGFAEMDSEQSKKIANSQYVANPGCYPTGAISILRPLRHSNILPSDYPVTINAVSGYSGGGKQLIAQMEDPNQNDVIHSNYFLYGLNLQHKHIPEITLHGLLDNRPIFTPSVARFAQGMIVNVPLHLNYLNGKINKNAIYQLYCEYYRGHNIVEVENLEQTDILGRINAEELVNTDRLKIYITGNDNLVNIVAILDNLGKGASGAAVQNLNLMIG